MKFVIDMNMQDAIPATYIKEILDKALYTNLEDKRNFGDEYGITQTTVYPCGNEVFLNVDFEESFGSNDVYNAVVDAIVAVFNTNLIKSYLRLDKNAYFKELGKVLKTPYRENYMDLVRLYHSIDDWFLRSKQNEFCEKFCKPDDAPGHPTTITLWHEEVSGSGCTCYVTAHVELHIEDDNQVTITKMDRIQKSSKTFTLDEAHNYINQLTFDNIMKHFLAEEADVDVSIHYSGKTADRIKKAIANSAEPDMKIEEFIKEAVGRYVSLIEDNISTMEAKQFIDEELDRRKEYKKKRDNSCDHKCNCDCNNKVSHESKENSGIDWNAVAGNIFGNVFGDALKLLAEMNNDNNNKENDKND